MSGHKAGNHAGASPHLDPEVLARTPWEVYGPQEFGLGALRTHLTEVWQHGNLVAVLVQRELKVRYRGSILGFGWTLLNPLALLAIYSLVFSVYMRLDIEHYPLYLLSGLFPWLWLSQSLTSGSNSIIDDNALVTRVMLPPQLPPLVETLANGINFVLGLPVLLALSFAFGHLSPTAFLALPLLFFLQAALLLGLSLPLAAACVTFRDIKFLVQNAVTFWFFLTPIVYTKELVPESLRVLLHLNPFYYFAASYQTTLYEGHFPPLAWWGIQLAIALAAVLVGILTFERLRERVVEEL